MTGLMMPDTGSVYFPRRQEYKYFVLGSKLEALRARLHRYMDHDDFCRRTDSGLYSVRSIYLDTPSRRFYYEKIHGLKVRKKVRIRCYGTRDACKSAFLEIKHKAGSFGYKDRAEIPFIEVEKLIETADISPEVAIHLNGHRPALEKFVYCLARLNLQPSVLVTYEREAFVGREESDVRVTLDTSVRSLLEPEWEDMYREEHLRRITDPWFIMEVKFRLPLPFWMRQILRDFNLRRQAISKYCWAIDVWRFHEDVLGPY